MAGPFAIAGAAFGIGAGIGEIANQYLYIGAQAYNAKQRVKTIQEEKRFAKTTLRFQTAGLNRAADLTKTLSKQERQLLHEEKVNQRLDEAMSRGNMTGALRANTERSRIETDRAAALASGAGSSAFSRAFTTLGLTQGAEIESRLSGLEKQGVIQRGMINTKVAMSLAQEQKTMADIESQKRYFKDQYRSEQKRRDYAIDDARRQKKTYEQMQDNLQGGKASDFIDRNTDSIPGYGGGNDITSRW